MNLIDHHHHIAYMDLIGGADARTTDTAQWTRGVTWTATTTLRLGSRPPGARSTPAQRHTACSPRVGAHGSSRGSATATIAAAASCGWWIQQLGGFAEPLHQLRQRPTRPESDGDSGAGLGPDSPAPTTPGECVGGVRGVCVVSVVPACQAGSIELTRETQCRPLVRGRPNAGRCTP
jgi:hypothetical protein